MPTEFINAPGPFLGVSCLRWRWNDGQAIRPPFAVNVDISRGTIRCREGFTTIKRYTNTYRVLGVKGFRTVSDEPLVAALLWDEANFKTRFNVFGMDGSQISTSDLDIGVYPLGHAPNPWGFASFELMTSANGATVWITTPHGRVHEYSYDQSRLKPIVTKVNRLWKESPEADHHPFLDVLPRASIVHKFAGYTIYAGLDPKQWLGSSIRFADDQTDLSEEMIASSREQVRYPENCFLVSQALQPTNVKAKDFFGVASGQKITGISSLNSQLLIFTESAVHTAEFGGFGSSPVSRLGTLVEGVGCVSPRTVVSGRGRVAWMGHDGFHVWDGGQVRKISDDIEDMFQQTGWRADPLYSLGGTMGQFAYPFRIAKAQMHTACGVFDEERQCFWWSVAVDGADNDDIEKQARVCLLYYPSMDSWSIYTNGTNSTLSMTCMDSFFDGSEHRLLFGDQWGGIHFFGGDTSDKNKSSSGADGDTRLGIPMVWNSPEMQLNPNATYAARTIRVTQKATGSEPAVSWAVETERTFDSTDGVPSSTGLISQSPSQDPPESTDRTHLWSKGTWGEFNWHGGGVWRSRQSVSSALVGQAFRVGFAEATNYQLGLKGEIHSFALEVDAKRDIT